MGIDYTADYSGLIGWLLGLAILITATWFLVYYASRAATREVMGQISHVEVSVTADGRALRLLNTGALAAASIVVDRASAAAGRARASLVGRHARRRRDGDRRRPADDAGPTR
jgi:hypothetical protein